MTRTFSLPLVTAALAGVVEAAHAVPPTVTSADIERARQRHRMPTEAELAKVPVPAAPRLENLPQPQTSLSIDLEAIAKGFDTSSGTLLAAPGAPAGPRIFIFVSFSMPEATLRRLIEQAARAPATLILRGLVRGSIRDTATRLQALIGSQQVAVQIDPEAFDRYAVTTVPTFVLVQSGLAANNCGSRTCVSARPFTKVAGDVTLDYALRHLNGGTRIPGTGSSPPPRTPP